MVLPFGDPRTARADRVEGKISTLAFALSKEQTAALRQFAARVG